MPPAAPMYQNITIGGQTPDGKDAVNELTVLTLSSIARTRLPQPNLTVRYFKGMSEEFMQRCIDVIKLGFGMPAFNNDEIIIPALIKQGITKATPTITVPSAVWRLEYPVNGDTAAPV